MPQCIIHVGEAGSNYVVITNHGVNKEFGDRRIICWACFYPMQMAEKDRCPDVFGEACMRPSGHPGEHVGMSSSWPMANRCDAITSHGPCALPSDGHVRHFGCDAM